MKKIAIILIALVSFSAMGQTKFEKGMRKAFDLWESGQQWDAANVFERISQAEQDNWLPSYYAAMINITYSFGEKDEERLTANLAKGLDFLNTAKSISKDNAEIKVLEAMYYTAWIAYDGQQYGMQYSAKVMELYQTAAQLAPDNPHVVFGKAEWDMGAAKFFGQSTEPYCKDLQRAVELFSTFKPETEFHPDYGRDRIDEVIAQNCKS